MYRCEATLVEGFVQQLAVGYVHHGHFFYVTGRVPEHKNVRAVDAKLIERYGLKVSKWSRARAKAMGRASVQYIRHGRFFVLISTKGRHEFFEQEAQLRDIRRQPIRYGGYSVSYRQGVDRKWHVSVRIASDEYLRLKAYLVDLACHRSVAGIATEFWRLPFEPYAPVRRQLLNIMRAVNRKREAAGLEIAPFRVLRLRRRIMRPFVEASIEREVGDKERPNAPPVGCGLDLNTRTGRPLEGC